MLFNSIPFLFFLPTVFIIYWGIFQKSIKSQNAIILLASYVFYGWWDFRFLTLLFASTVVDFLIGKYLYKEKNKFRRKVLLSLSLIFNLGLLFFFKYYNFFIDNWIESWASLGVEMHASSLNIILPVGISFYTFQTWPIGVAVPWFVCP